MMVETHYVNKFAVYSVEEAAAFVEKQNLHLADLRRFSNYISDEIELWFANTDEQQPGKKMRLCPAGCNRSVCTCNDGRGQFLENWLPIAEFQQQLVFPQLTEYCRDVKATDRDLYNRIMTGENPKPYVYKYQEIELYEKGIK